MIATDDPNLVFQQFQRGSDLVIREFLVTNAARLNCLGTRWMREQRCLRPLNRTFGPAHFEEVEEALQDNSPLQDQFADYIRSTTKETRRWIYWIKR